MTDKQILDWIESHSAISIYGPDNWTFKEWSVESPGFISNTHPRAFGRGKTLREAVIDAATGENRHD